MISYAGVALGLPTAELVDFIESTIDPRDAFLFASRTFPGTRLNSLPFRQGLTFPPVRLGRLWWPAGASRFALFYGLADQAQLDLIRAVVYPSAGDYQAAPLVLADGVNTLTTDLWMLPPRPLQGLTDLPLYLLTLVDERYFWWFRSSSLAVVGGTTTWTDLFDQIEAALDITLTTDTIPAAYLKPGDGFSLNDEPLPIVLDAVCASAGLRLVRQLDGTCHAWDAENSRDQTAAFLLTVPTAGIIDGSAGGVFQLGTEAPLADDVAVLPDSVTVVYPISDSGAAAGDIEYTVPLVDLALDDFADVVGFPGSKCFHCSAVALGTGTPTNDAALQALAEQIATDFYRWQCGRLDLRLVGYPAYTITGLDDVVLYDHGADLSTRILRGPWLDHLEELLVWTGPQPGTGTTLAVGEVDLAPFIDPTSILLFDQADGFVVTNPSAGVAQVNITTSSTPVFSGARAYRTTDQTITYSTEQAVLYASEDYDTDSYHDTGSNTGRMTAPFTGYYLLGGVNYWLFPVGASSTSIITSLRKNGTTTIDRVWDVFSGTPGGYYRQMVGNVGPVLLTAGDYVETTAYWQNGLSGITVKVLGSTTLGAFSPSGGGTGFGHFSGMWMHYLGT